jgi:hypothetical protein
MRLAGRAVAAWAGYNEYLRVNTRASYYFMHRRLHLTLRAVFEEWLSDLLPSSTLQLRLSDRARSLRRRHRASMLGAAWGRLRAYVLLMVQMERTGPVLLSRRQV